MILLSTAFAAPVSGSVSLGFDLGVNDPFVNRSGPRVTGAVRFRDVLELQVMAAWYPSDGQAGCKSTDWTTLACRLLTHASVSPDISLIEGRVGGAVAWLPLQTGGSWSTGAGLYVGVNAVYTVDSLEALQAVGDADAIATQKEWHPGLTGGLVGDLHNEHFGFRLRLEGLRYTEMIWSVHTEDKQPVFLGVDSYLRF